MSLRARVVVVLAAVLLLGTAALSPALARYSGGTRDVQEKLAVLGYETGPIDGIYGRMTKGAVLEFQRDAGIRVDGVVGPETREALHRIYELRKRPRAENIQLDVYEDTLTDRLMEGKAELSSRYSAVHLLMASTGRYVLSLNDQIVSTSPFGVGVPRISRTFELPGEDVYLLSSATGKRECPVEHMVFAVRANGSFMKPTPIGNCSELLNARIQDDALVVAFPPKDVPSWRLEESWMYRHGQVSMK